MDWSSLARSTRFERAVRTRDWQRNRQMWIRVLERQTGAGLDAWNERIRKRSFADVRALRAWLSKQAV